MRELVFYIINLVAFLGWLYLVVLIGRMILDWVQILSRDWRPKGIVLILANLIYSLTDPPFRALGRLVPPLRLGAVALDMGFFILFIGISLFLRLLSVVATVI